MSIPYIRYNNIKYFAKASNYKNKLNIKSYDVVSQLWCGGATIDYVATQIDNGEVLTKSIL